MLLKQMQTGKWTMSDRSLYVAPKIKCSVCGRYMSEYDIFFDSFVKYTPDSEFTSERIIYTHRLCTMKERHDDVQN